MADSDRSLSELERARHHDAHEMWLIEYECHTCVPVSHNDGTDNLPMSLTPELCVLQRGTQKAKKNLSSGKKIIANLIFVIL